MNRNQLIRMIIYIILVLGILLFLCKLFKYDNWHTTYRFETYRELPKGSVDAVYIGSSAVDRFWNCAQAYEEYGMVVYPLSTESQPGILVRYVIEEALRYQTPQLILIDIRGFASDTLNFTDMQIPLSRFTSIIPITSPVYWKSTTAYLNMLHKADPEKYKGFDLSYYLQFINYHDKWSDENFRLDELIAPPSEYLGFYLSERSTKKMSKGDAEKFEAWVLPTEEEPINHIQEELLYDLFDYIKKNDLDVLFINTPHYYNEQHAGRYLTIENLVKKEGFDMLVLTTQDMELDIANDYYDTGHVNYYGAEKYTSFLGKYLFEHYSFTDHRMDKDTSAFDGIQQKIENAIWKME